MSRMRIHHIMVVVAFVAIAVALSRPGIVTPGSGSTHFLVPMALLGVILAFAGFSWLIVRPGAHRDWLMAFFIWLSFIGVTISSTIELLSGTGQRDRLLWALMFLPTLFYCTWIAIQALIPERCPHCGKRKLLKAETNRWRRPPEIMLSQAELRARGEPDHRSYYHCEACGLVSELSRAQARQGCPNCEGEPLFRLWRTEHGFEPPQSISRFEYYWCLGCKARCKQVVPGVWEQAVSPEDDRPYARWDLIGWLGHRIDGTAKKAR
jgi:predicted RNA-binding Zn-ribbon protein involved in translation (DUF1610 family)